MLLNKKLIRACSAECVSVPALTEARKEKVLEIMRGTFLQKMVIAPIVVLQGKKQHTKQRARDLV